MSSVVVEKLSSDTKFVNGSVLTLNVCGHGEQRNVAPCQVGVESEHPDKGCAGFELNGGKSLPVECSDASDGHVVNTVPFERVSPSGFATKALDLTVEEAIDAGVYDGMLMAEGFDLKNVSTCLTPEFVHAWNENCSALRLMRQVETLCVFCSRPVCCVGEFAVDFRQCDICSKCQSSGCFCQVCGTVVDGMCSKHFLDGVCLFTFPLEISGVVDDGYGSANLL